MCLLCGDRTRKNCGPILTSLNCHLLCLKFSSGILDSAQPPRDVEVAREVRRVQKLKCVFCKEYGAFVGCNIKVRLLPPLCTGDGDSECKIFPVQQCSLTYHLHCGHSHGCLHQYDPFSSYCPTHRFKNLLPSPPNPTPSCHLCSGLITEDKDLVVCGECKISLHIQCCQERVSQGQSSRQQIISSKTCIFSSQVSSQVVHVRAAGSHRSSLRSSVSTESGSETPQRE